MCWTVPSNNIGIAMSQLVVDNARCDIIFGLNVPDGEQSSAPTQICGAHEGGRSDRGSAAWTMRLRLDCFISTVQLGLCRGLKHATGHQTLHEPPLSIEYCVHASRL